MKGFMKGCAVTALIFAVLGGVLVMIGGSFAGRDIVTQVVEEATGGRIHVVTDHWWSWALNMRDDWGDGTASERAADVDRGIPDDPAVPGGMYSALEGNAERLCSGSEIRNLDIDLGGCEFWTDYSDGDDIYLEVSDPDKFRGRVKGDTLYVETVDPNIKALTDITDRQVILYLPSGISFDEVDISMGAGVVGLGELYADEASLEVGAGKIDISYAEVRDLDVSVGAGSVEVSYMEADSLDAEVGMGEFIAYGDISQEADVECSMGNIEMTLSGSEEDFDYEIESSMGNVDIGSSSYSGMGKEKHISNGAGREIKVECSMGNISIQFDGGE